MDLRKYVPQFPLSVFVYYYSAKFKGLGLEKYVEYMLNMSYYWTCSDSANLSKIITLLSIYLVFSHKLMCTHYSLMSYF